jgi:hypothetical protein
MAAYAPGSPRATSTPALALPRAPVEPRHFAARPASSETRTARIWMEWIRMDVTQNIEVVCPGVREIWKEEIKCLSKTR